MDVWTLLRAHLRGEIETPETTIGSLPGEGPQIALHPIDAPAGTTTAPTADHHAQIDVWGTDSYDACAELRDQVLAVLDAIGSLAEDDLVVHGLSVDDRGTWSPDQTTSRPRFIIHITVSATRA